MNLRSKHDYHTYKSYKDLISVLKCLYENQTDTRTHVRAHTHCQYAGFSNGILTIYRGFG